MCWIYQKSVIFSKHETIINSIVVNTELKVWIPTYSYNTKGCRKEAKKGEKVKVEKGTEMSRVAEGACGCLNTGHFPFRYLYLQADPTHSQQHLKISNSCSVCLHLSLKSSLSQNSISLSARANVYRKGREIAYLWLLFLCVPTQRTQDVLFVMKFIPISVPYFLLPKSPSDSILICSPRAKCPIIKLHFYIM